MQRGGYRNRGGRGGRGNFSGRGRSTQPQGLFADGTWHCNCSPRLPAEHFRVKKEGKNQGRWFYTCQNAEPNRCGFFLWDEDAKIREKAAVLSNKRTEPGVQEGWNAGREQSEVNGKGLFARNKSHAPTGSNKDDDSTESPSPSPAHIFNASGRQGTKRDAQAAALDGDEFDDWQLSDNDENFLASTADAAEFKTPHKAQKTGAYATPATTGNRKLPWMMSEQEPTTPLVSKHSDDYFTTPSKPGAGSESAFIKNESPETPAAPPTLANITTPSPPTRHRDALCNPADSASSLTSELLSVMPSTSVPPDIISKVRSIATKHDLKAQGVAKGRDISRLAIKAKDAKIAELQAKIDGLIAEREMSRSVSRYKKWESENAQS